MSYKNFSVHARSKRHYTEIVSVSLEENEAIKCMKDFMEENEEFNRAWVEEGIKHKNGEKYSLHRIVRTKENKIISQLLT